MAEQLDIYVTDDGVKTISRFAADRISFHNEGSADMTIGFKPNQPQPLRFCKNKNDDHTKGTTTLDIKKDKKDDVYICSDFPGTTVGYTAQIGTTDKEDPIIILGKDSMSPSLGIDVPSFAGGLLLGIVLALLAQRLFMRRRPT